MAANGVKGSPFRDPRIRWYVYPSLNHLNIFRGDTPSTNAIQYSCDDAICVPRYFGGFMSWYDPSSGSVGGRMFNLQEAWDHSTWKNPNDGEPYDGKSVWIPGFRGFFLAVSLTDGTKKVQVNIIRRYLDDTILIFNVGRYGDTRSGISVTVYDPPSGLGYKKITSGSITANGTVLAPGQYVLFYKGDTPPEVDTGNGIFKKSPFGSSKTYQYELWVNSFMWKNLIWIPKMYLGVKAPGADMEIVSNGALPGVRITSIPSGTSGDYPYPMIGGVGADWVGSKSSTIGQLNVSRLIEQPVPGVLITRADSNYGGWRSGNMTFGAWFGWGEDENGNVRFIIFSQFIISIDTGGFERLRHYAAYIYDVDRDEAYFTVITRGIVDSYVSWPEVPLYIPLTPWGYTNASRVAYMKYDDSFETAYSPAILSGYGSCYFYEDMVVCLEGSGVYSNDNEFYAPNPKYMLEIIDLVSPYVPSLGAMIYDSAHVYTVAFRLKTFPPTVTDTDLRNWFLSLPPKWLSASDFDEALGVLPGSFWFFDSLTDAVTVSVPSPVKAGSTISVNVSCPTRPLSDMWVMLVDGNGNIVSTNEGLTDGNGNATVSLIVPTTVGRYRVQAVIVGDRKLL